MISKEFLDGVGIGLTIVNFVLLMFIANAIL